MPLTMKEYEQIETALDLVGLQGDTIGLVGVKKLLSKYVSDEPPAPPPTNADQAMGLRYDGPGCFVCRGLSKPCNVCGYPDEKKKDRIPQPGETGRKEFLQEGTATRLVEIDNGNGPPLWLNVPEEAVSDVGKMPVLEGKVYKYDGTKLIYCPEETARMQDAAKRGDRSRLIIPGG